MSTGVSTRMTGPFFQKDPGKTFRQNVRLMMRAVAAEGASRAIARMSGGGRRPLSIGGRAADYVVGRVESLTGKQWAVSAVVSVNSSGLSRREAIALTAGASRVESETHAFRRVTSEMRSARSANLGELLKDIA